MCQGKVPPAGFGGAISRVDVKTHRLCHWAGEPASRRAAESQPAAAPPSAQAPGNRARLVRTSPEDYRRRTPRMWRPDTVVFRLSPPLAALSLSALGHSQWQEPPIFADATATRPTAVKCCRSRAIRLPGRYGRVRAVRASPSNAVACQRVTRRHTRYPVTRRSTRATHARAAPGVHIGQSATKTPPKASHKARKWPEECVGPTPPRSTSVPCILLSLAGNGLSEVVSKSLHFPDERLGFVTAVTWNLSPRGVEY